MKNTTFPSDFKENAYHETKRHSDTMFAYNVYPCTIPLDFYSVPVHWQDSVEIIYIKKGKGYVQIDFETFTAQEKDIFIILPGRMHGLKRFPAERMEYENIIFDLDFLGTRNIDLCSQKYWHPLNSGTLTVPTRINTGHTLHEKISAFLDASDKLCSRKPNGYELAVKGNLLLIFSLLFSQSFDTVPSEFVQRNQKDIQKLKTLLLFLEENYDQKITIEKMAEHCGYSASHFMRWFKDMTGQSFMNYLIDYRLEKSAQDLQDNTLSILEISEANGFHNLSNFNRLFKQKFGATPGQFRKTAGLSRT